MIYLIFYDANKCYSILIFYIQNNDIYHTMSKNYQCINQKTDSHTYIFQGTQVQDLLLNL